MKRPPPVWTTSGGHSPTPRTLVNVMMQDQSRNRTPMPAAQLPAGAAPPKPGPARAEAGIARMLAEDVAPVTALPGGPAPGSLEAMEMFGIACREVDCAGTADMAETEALRINNGCVLWTSEAVRQAQSGNFSRFNAADVEAARATPSARLDELLVMALRREMRMAEAVQASGLRQLYSVAYPEAETGIDAAPVSAAIREHLFARAALNATLNPDDEVAVLQAGLSGEALNRQRVTYDAADARERAAWGALFELRPEGAGDLSRVIRYVATSPAFDDDTNAIRDRVLDFAEAVEALKLGTEAAQSADYDRPLIHLARKFDAAARRETVLVSAEYEDVAHDAGEKTEALARQMIALPARTLAGVQAKLRIAAFYGTCDPDHEHVDDYPGEAAIRSLYRDVPSIEVSTDPADIRIGEAPLAQRSQAAFFADSRPTTTAETARDLSKEAFDYARSLDLSAVPFSNLLHLYDLFSATYDHLCLAEDESMFSEEIQPTLRRSTAGGLVLAAEINRLGCLRDAMKNELERRRPRTEAERDHRLYVLITHELKCDGSITDRALLSEINMAWGA